MGRGTSKIKRGARGTVALRKPLLHALFVISHKPGRTDYIYIYIKTKDTYIYVYISVEGFGVTRNRTTRGPTGSSGICSRSSRAGSGSSRTVREFPDGARELADLVRNLPGRVAPSPHVLYKSCGRAGTVLHWTKEATGVDCIDVASALSDKDDELTDCASPSRSTPTPHSPHSPPCVTPTSTPMPRPPLPPPPASPPPLSPCDTPSRRDKPRVVLHWSPDGVRVGCESLAMGSSTQRNADAQLPMLFAGPPTPGAQPMPVSNSVATSMPMMLVAPAPSAPMLFAGPPTPVAAPMPVSKSVATSVPMMPVAAAPSTPMPYGTPAVSAPSTPAYPAPQTQTAPATPAFAAPSTPAFFAPSTPAFAAPSTPAFPAPSTPALPAPSTPAFPTPSTPTLPAPSTPGLPAPSTPGSPLHPLLFFHARWSRFGVKAPAFGLRICKPRMQTARI